MGLSNEELGREGAKHVGKKERELSTETEVVLLHRKKISSWVDVFYHDRDPKR